MRLNRLDLNLLVALDALLTEKSITRAAERIYLSQPATSGALARLREFFGDELLVRVGAQMKPTPLGESLAVPVNNILMQIQATVDRGLEFTPETSDRRFRLLMSDYSMSTLINPLIGHLTEIAPHVELEMILPTNNPAEQLEQGEVDFLVMPEHVMSQAHPKSNLFEEGFVCIGCAKNPIFDGELSAKEFLNSGHVTVKFGSTRKSSQDQELLLKHHGVEPKREIITPTFNAIPPLLLGTRRIATVYEHLAIDWLKLLPLKQASVPFDLPKIPWAIQWHKYRDLDPGIQWLRTQILAVAKEHLC